MNLDWEKIFVPDNPLLSLFLRGTLMYIGLLAALRFLVRRHVGTMSLMDLLLMVLIADAAQNAMAAEYHSVTEGAVLCGTLIFWNCLFDWLAYRSPAFSRLLEPPPLPIIRDGQFLRDNMRQEFMTDDEVLSHLRQHGIEDADVVKLACVEPDGGVSVIKRGAPTTPSRPKKAPAWSSDANRLPSFQARCHAPQILC